MARLIEFFTRPGELVIDPFAGVGRDGPADGEEPRPVPETTTPQVWADYRAGTAQATAEVAERLFAGVEPEPRPAVTLVDFDPDGEDKLLAAMLYPHLDLPDDQMKRVVDYVESGRPVIGMRTATHAFDVKGGKTFARDRQIGEPRVGHVDDRAGTLSSLQEDLADSRGWQVHAADHRRLVGDAPAGRAGCRRFDAMSSPRSSLQATAAARSRALTPSPTEG